MGKLGVVIVVGCVEERLQNKYDKVSMGETASELHWSIHMPFRCSVLLHVLPLFGTIVCPSFVRLQVAEGRVSHIVSAPTPSDHECVTTPQALGVPLRSYFCPAVIEFCRHTCK
jgi:hypothetical protein